MSDRVAILLVDDEPRNLDALDVVLGDANYHLLRASDAQTALKTLLEHDVAAIVLDIKMPGTSGVELAQIIKATRRFREIPILFLTAYMIGDQDVIAGYGAGAVDYLVKPINPQILRHKVAVYAELFRKTRALAELNEKLEERVSARTAELECSEAALRAADQKKDEFIATLAHELRNPLVPLRIGLDILSRQQGTPSTVVTTTLTTMSRQLGHMVRLIDDLLDISRVTRGMIELKKSPIEISETVRAALEIAHPFFERRHHVVSLNLKAGVRVLADVTRVTQAMGNLLHNAAKFTPDGGEIRIEVTDEGDQAVIRVIDTGVGIAPEQIEGAFQMFARIERASSVNDGGLGIGLALARRLAELHGGSLTAVSEGLGRGTTFTLRLPALIDKAEKSGEVMVERAIPFASTLKVVLIEDSDDIADMLAAWLEGLGHEVLVARSGSDGVELVRKEGPRLVLCDLGLPGMDGLEVCRRIRALELDRQPTMVAITGWGRDSDRVRTKEVGFDEHLVKPVEVSRLRQLLSTVADAT